MSTLRTNVMIRVDDELLRRIRVAADADDRSVSSYLRRIIEAHVPKK